MYQLEVEFVSILMDILKLCLIAQKLLFQYYGTLEL